ncbi:hypothetical protein Tco_0271344 [Tanacetum coccineum]
MQLKKGRREIMPYPKFTKIIINHFPSKHQSLTKLHYLHTHTIKDDGAVNRLKFVKIGKDFHEYGLPIPETMLTERIKQSESYQMFIKYSTGLIPPKKSRDDNIIPDPDVALELGKSMSLTEAAEVEAARQGIQTLTPKEKIAADTMQALKANRKSSRSRSFTRGSSEGTGVSPGVSDESIVIPVTSSEGTKSEYSKEDQGDDENIPWESTDEDEEKKDDDDVDDDKSIDLEKTDDEETDDEFVHSGEYVQDDDGETDDELVHGDEQVNDDEDEEMTNAEDADTGNGDEEVTDTEKADAEKTEEVKDDIKKAELPPLSSSLSVSSDRLPAIIQRVAVLEKYVQELKEVDHTTTLHASLRSEIPLAAVSDFATPVVQSTVKNALEKTQLLVAQSSSQAQSSLQAAKSLSDYELKTILFEKMDKSRSYLTHDKHQALFDALLNSMSLDDSIARGQANPEKVLRKRDRDDKDPLARPNQGKKTKRSRTKESEPSKKSSTSKESSKGKSPTKTSKSRKFVTADEPVFEMAFDDIEQTIDDDSTQNKDKVQSKIGSNNLQGLLLLIQNGTSIKL